MKIWKAPKFRKNELVRIKGTAIESRVVAIDIDYKLYMLEVPELPMQAEYQLEKVTIINGNQT